jgi:vitamin B12 transporter
VNQILKLWPLLTCFLLLPVNAGGGEFNEELFNEGFYFTDFEGITVVGTVQTSQQIAVIEREQIVHSGASDVANLLQSTIGLNIVRYGAYGNQAGVNLRGFDSKRVAFLINGMPANSLMDGRFDITQIDTNSIERIEVIYGGSDSKYNVSGAFGGVVNIITMRKQEQGLRLTASVSNTSTMPGEYRDRNGEMQPPRWEDLFDTQSYSLSAAYGAEVFSITADVFFNRAENHFVFLDHINRLRRKDNNEVWDTGTSASLVWNINDLTKLLVSSNIYYGDKNFPISGFSGNFGNQRDFYIRESLMIDTPRIFHDDLAAEVSLAWQFHRRDYTSPAGVFSRHDQNSLTMINRWNWFPSSRFTLRSGIDYRYTGLDSTEIGDRSRHDGGLYLTAELKPLRQFQIIPSAKLISTSEGSGNTAVIPKLGLLWNVTDSLSIKNNYFRSFKFPDFEELYWSGGGGIGNPNLRPEDGWGADFGVLWRITNLLQLESMFFTQWIYNSIHWFSRTGGIWRPENVGEAVLFGLDNKVGYNIPVSNKFIREISAAFSYQYLLSYLLSYGYTFASSKRIPYNPEHTINGSLGVSWTGGFMSINGQYTGIRFHDTSNLTLLQPVFLLNVSINQKAGKNLTLFGALRNILNTSYESFYDYPMPGVTLTLGLRVEL